MCVVVCVCAIKRLRTPQHLKYIFFYQSRSFYSPLVTHRVHAGS